MANASISAPERYARDFDVSCYGKTDFSQVRLLFLQDVLCELCRVAGLIGHCASCLLTGSVDSNEQGMRSLLVEGFCELSQNMTSWDFFELVRHSVRFHREVEQGSFMGLCHMRSDSILGLSHHDVFAHCTLCMDPGQTTVLIDAKKGVLACFALDAAKCKLRSQRFFLIAPKKEGEVATSLISAGQE